MKVLKYAISALMGLGLLMGAQGVLAATCSNNFSLTAATPTEGAGNITCSGSGIGNPTPSDDSKIYLASVNREPPEDEDFNPLGFSLVNNGSNGTFTIPDSVWADWLSIEVTFKQGTNWATFLVEAVVNTALYVGFPPAEGGGDWSHYFVAGGQEVPIPAAAWLFASGFAAVGFSRRKKANKDSLAM